MKEKRYVAVIEMYIYAENDMLAITQVNNFCREERRKKDNRCSILKIVEQSFGTLETRDVYKNPLKFKN